MIAVLGPRPNASSTALSFESKCSGVSVRSGIRAATAFRNAGDPGGQSTGVVFQIDERTSGSTEKSWSFWNARRRMFAESPRFEPSATNAYSSHDLAFGVGMRFVLA